MNDAIIDAQIHRFGKHVALYVGNGETVYITPNDARTLANALNACADEIVNVPNFAQSTVGSKEWQFKGKR